ncbi:amidohydrolase family protein [Nocardiopsis suaedae]|uniref:Amidohydrolase family protein n=1 Tax=Nocardiopsis suaedae TaxID=3018444 RepID=A0ABT4TUQ6_9ACTN|nr:amidohydrolase family protein [Nocardiopsis suaedae]MDA2808425.1 amidohydrolase family protein [Nocardiopsis suaedae]
MTTAASTPCDLLVSDVTVWTGGRWRERVDVAVDGGRITRIAPHGAEPASARRTLHGRGAHVVPGIVNTHTHLNQALLRGTAEGRPLLSWLGEVGEATAALTAEQAYTAAACAALEALRTGTTTVVEHMWPHPSRAVHEAVVLALEDAGVRGVVCVGIADRADPSRRWGMDPRLIRPVEEVLDHVLELADRTRGGPLRVGLAVPNPRCLTPAGMARVRAFADEHRLPVSIHLLETATDEEMCLEHTGRGAVRLLQESGLLWERLLAVHCVRLDGAGREALAGAGAAVSYNPLSNMRLGSGVAPVPELLEAGVPVGIGVDGAASNDRQDALEALRIGSYLQRVAHRRADLLDFARMMDMAADGACRVLGLEGAPGGLAEGGPADLLVLRFDADVGCVPVADPGAVLLTTGSQRVVETVVADGRVVLDGGVHPVLDERELVARAQAVAPRATAAVLP